MKLSTKLAALVIWIVCIFSNRTFCQIDESRIFSDRIVGGCINDSSGSDVAFQSDSTINAFFEIVQRNTSENSRSLPTNKHLVAVLDRVISTNDSSCLLPFLAAIDRKAYNVYAAECKMKPNFTVHTQYCKVLPVKWLVAFYIEFVCMRRVKLSKSEYVSRISLEKKTSSASGSVFSNEDLDKICTIYKVWLTNNTKALRHRNILKGSGYRWNFSLTCK